MNTPTHTDRAGLGEQKPNPVQVRPRRRPMLMAGGALLAIALVVGFIPRLKQRQMSAADTKQLAVSTVAVVSPAVHLPGSGLDLPAEVKPWQEASIYSRVNGYLKSWQVDIGAHVEQGQLLAEVDVPDLQQQMDQAQSQLTLAQHNLQLAKDNNVRFQQLFKEGVVSQMDSDTQSTTQATNQANVEAFSANLKFLQQEVAFQKITAPFPGTITVRNVNVGDLITANNTSFEMFHIQQMNPLRVYFRIPENEAPNIATGQTFNVQIGADSGKGLPGKVSSTSDAVSPDSRTMLVELQVDNPKNEIYSGQLRDGARAAGDARKSDDCSGQHPDLSRQNPPSWRRGRQRRRPTPRRKSRTRLRRSIRDPGRPDRVRQANRQPI